MTRLFYQLPNGTPTADLSALVPAAINPQFLTAAELAEFGVAECVVNYPSVAWWQELGAKLIDTTLPVHAITWAVTNRALVETQQMAWEKIKERRAIERQKGVSFVFSDGQTGTIQIRDEDITNLLAIHAAAATALMTDNATQTPFTDAENQTRFLEPAEVLRLVMAAFAHSAHVHVTSQTIRTAINSADSVSKVVDATKWPGDE